jgi:hypothetical protein
MSDETALTDARNAIAEAVAALREGGVADEALAEFVPEHRVLLVKRSATMRKLGRVWRLGVLLIDESGRLFVGGGHTRAQSSGHPNFQSLSAEQRREYREAAKHAGFAEGESVNFEAREIAFESSLRTSPGVIALDDEGVKVRWSPEGGLVPLRAYLAERVELALRPPQGAGD